MCQAFCLDWAKTVTQTHLFPYQNASARSLGKGLAVRSSRCQARRLCNTRIFRFYSAFHPSGSQWHTPARNPNQQLSVLIHSENLYRTMNKELFACTRFHTWFSIWFIARSKTSILTFEPCSLSMHLVFIAQNIEKRCACHTKKNKWQLWILTFSACISALRNIYKRWDIWRERNHKEWLLLLLFIQRAFKFPAAHTADQILWILFHRRPSFQYPDEVRVYIDLVARCICCGYYPADRITKMPFWAGNRLPLQPRYLQLFQHLDGNVNQNPTPICVIRSRGSKSTHHIANRIFHQCGCGQFMKLIKPQFDRIILKIQLF